MGSWQYINKFCPDFLISICSPLFLNKFALISLQNQIAGEDNRRNSGAVAGHPRVAAPPPELFFFKFFQIFL
jgi:hypothetical protein